MHYPLRFNIFSLLIHELHFLTVLLNCGKKCKLVFSVKFTGGCMCLELIENVERDHVLLTCRLLLLKLRENTRITLFSFYHSLGSYVLQNKVHA